MSIKFRGGYPSQRGRGIGGLLRAAGSLFKPLFKTLSSTALKAARSNTGKMIGNALKEQAIDSAVKLGVDAMRGEDMDVSLQNEMQHVKRKAADGIENVHSIRKKQRKAATKTKTATKTKARTKVKPVGAKVIPKKDFFG